MNIWQLLGYTGDKQYPEQSITNIGQFALVKSGGVTPTRKLYLENIQLQNIYLGSTKINTIYYGSTAVLLN